MRSWIYAVMASVVLTCVLLTSAVFAAPGPDEILTDPREEAQAQALYDVLRCVVCQSQSLSHSDAPLAADMRAVVRERVQAGDSHQDVLDYMQARYGDYVLLSPPLQGNTIALWVWPFLALFLGAIGVMAYIRHQTGRSVPEELSEADSAAARALMEEEGRE